MNIVEASRTNQHDLNILSISKIDEIKLFRHILNNCSSFHTMQYQLGYPLRSVKRNPDHVLLMEHILKSTKPASSPDLRTTV